MTMRSVLLGMAVVALPGWAAAQGASSSFVLAGEVGQSQTYSLASLSQLPATRQNVTFYVGGSGLVTTAYTGVLLWDLLTKAGIVTDPAVKNDILRKIVVVVGSDGYVAALSLGEIAPQFGGEQAMVAYEANGAPLGSNAGFAELVMPGDKAGGRAVNRITGIYLVGG